MNITASVGDIIEERVRDEVAGRRDEHDVAAVGIDARLLRLTVGRIALGRPSDELGGARLAVVEVHAEGDRLFRGHPLHQKAAEDAAEHVPLAA